MTPSETPDDPYARIAPLYDAEFADATADLGWYARHLTATPTLVLGCGSGRIAPALPPSVRCVGVDRSPPMIARAAERHPTHRWVVGDMRQFDLGRFGQVVVPNAAFSFLPTRADQAACLASCAAALTAGGSLILDLPMPDPRWLGESHTPEKPAWSGVVDGVPVRRTREVERRPVAQRLTLIDRWFVADDPPIVSTLQLRWIWPAEVEWMLEAAGFYVEATYGDYADRPLHEDCPRLLVHART